MKPDTEERVDDFLEHFGVKGMRWGVRRDSAGSAQAVTTKVTPGKKVSATGGSGLHPSDDAIRVAGLKQKAKKSSTDALTTKEMQDLVQRMNLESQYSKLQHSSSGKKFVKKLMSKDGQKKMKAVASGLGTAATILGAVLAARQARGPAGYAYQAARMSGSLAGKRAAITR